MKNHQTEASASPDPAFTAELLAVRWTENLQNLRLRTGPQRLQGAWQLTVDHDSLVAAASGCRALKFATGRRLGDVVR